MNVPYHLQGLTFCSTALANSIQDKVLEFENHIEQVNMEDCYSASPPLTTKALLDSMPDEELMAQVFYESALNNCPVCLSS